jgi:hypothetical protein
MKSTADQSGSAQAAWIPADERPPTVRGVYLVALADPDDVGWKTDRAWWCEWDGVWDTASSCGPIEDGMPITHWLDGVPPLPLKTALAVNDAMRNGDKG